MVPASENHVQSRASAGFNLYYATQGGQEGIGNVAPVTSAKELMTVMQDAVHKGLSFSIVAGGHGYEGRGPTAAGTALHTFVAGTTEPHAEPHGRANIQGRGAICRPPAAGLAPPRRL